MAFTKVWDETTPVGTDPVSIVDDKIREFKYAIRERGGAQHKTYADETNKTDVWEHKPGECNVVFIGAKANFPTPTSTNSGCIAIATDENNQWYYWDGTQWVALGPLSPFRSGDMMLSSNPTPPSGWSDVSTTYENKFIRISSGTPLTTGGADAHTHGAGSYASQNHTHTLETGNKGGDVSDGVQYDPNTNYMWNEGADLYFNNTVKINTVSGGGTAITGTSASASNVPAYIQLRLYQKS